MVNGNGTSTAMFSLAGRTALITGGGQGVGAETARVLAAAGAAVAVNDLDGDRAGRVVDELRAGGARAATAVGDVTDPSAVEELFATAESALGPVDVLVNNAGIPPGGVGARPFVDSTPAQWRGLIDLNLHAVLHCTHRALPSMIERGWGRIITIVSDAGRIGEPNIAVYAAAKAAAAAFSRSLAKEVGRFGITCNCISLGSIAGANRSEETLRRAARHYPTGRLGRADDVAPAVLYLASPEAEWVTAQTLPVDGGYAPS